MKWIQNIDPNFDISRILFRRYLQKKHFLAMLKLVNLCLDPGLPRTLHTGTGDALSVFKPIVTIDNRDFGMHAGVGAEIVSATGLREFLVAVNEDDFLDKAVDLFTHQDKLIHLESVLRTQHTAGIGYFKQDRVTRLLEYCFHTAVSSFVSAKGDRSKLRDIIIPDDVFTATNGIVSTNLDVPFCFQTDPGTHKRNQLLKQMLDSKLPLDPNMIDSAENIMKEIEANGIELHDIIASEKTAFTISASVNKGNKAGTKIALKLAKKGRPLQRITNDPAIMPRHMPCS